MVKMIAMVKRKSGLTIEEFSQYWYEKHAPFARKQVPQSVAAGWKGYVQNYALGLGLKGEPPFDGVAEFYFNDLQSFWKWNDWYFSDAAKALRDDEKNFMDRSKTVVVVADERVVIP